MLGTPKPMASLSSSLLARKGQAKPAMRPQGFVGLSPGTTQDDLGWNDMGEEAHPAPAPKPEVLRQIEALDQKIAQAAAPVAVPAPEPTPEPVAAPMPVAAPSPVAAPRAAKAAAPRKIKSAFTLRLDNDRHLRLRLASALTHRSAQQLVCQALDAFLESMTEVEALARQIDPAKDHG